MYVPDVLGSHQKGKLVKDGKVSLIIKSPYDLFIEEFDLLGLDRTDHFVVYFSTLEWGMESDGLQWWICLWAHDGRKIVKKRIRERRNSQFSVQQHTTFTEGEMGWRSICYESRFSSSSNSRKIKCDSLCQWCFWTNDKTIFSTTSSYAT